MIHRILYSLVYLFFTTNLAHAVAEAGTGSPTIQMAVDDNQRIALAIQDGDVVLQGSQTAQQGYAELALDAYLQDQAGVLPDAARAEVLLGCGQAHIIIYHQVQGAWQEYSAETVVVDVCVQ